ncbi:MAG: hypothetical protein K0S82_1671, partial [Gaiellaceae bacterium]|nr:hypothetical protein [Gaiellaceae bacterium]
SAGGFQSAHESSHQPPPPDTSERRRAPSAANRRSLFGLGDPLLHLLRVLGMPLTTVLAPQVELVVTSVVAMEGSPERLLEVELPARELPSRPLPEEPDRVRIAGSTEDDDSVLCPSAFAAPGVGDGIAVAVQHCDLSALRDVDGQQLRLVLNDDRRCPDPRNASPEVAPSDHIAGPPGHCGQP